MDIETVATRRYLFLDFENVMTSAVNLRKLTLRQYLAAAPVLGCGWAMDNNPAQFTPASDPTWPRLVEWLRALANEPNVVFCAHNASYDVRCARFGWTEQHGPLDIPQPNIVHCSLELAHAAWPNQPGGYSLKQLAQTLNLGAQKLDIDLHEGKFTDSELAQYCKRDVDLCRAIHQRAIKRVSSQELRVAELANQVRELHLEVDQTRVQTALLSLGNVATSSITDALTSLGRDGDTAYNYTGVTVKSVKPQQLKKLLLDNLGFDTQTISIKKLNPSKLTENPHAEKVIRQTAQANKALSHRRRVNVFTGVGLVDVELGYARAHTFRYSSPSTGRGLNLHNLPKRDKSVAKPIRQMFRLPNEYCFVRADEANAEYRIGGWLAGCHHIKTLFTANALADPYSAFWLGATGNTVTKADPARQVAKVAVLGLIFLMGIGTWIAELLKALADPSFKVSLADLAAICKQRGWVLPQDQWLRAQMTKHHAPVEVATVAYYTREAFHKIHPEIIRLARWLQNTCESVAHAAGVMPGSEMAAIDRAYSLPNAPDRNKLDLLIDTDLGSTTIRVKCGPWSETVCWRDMGMHHTKFGYLFSNLQAGNKGYRKFTPNVAIENVVQSCARNTIVKAKLQLERMGHPYLMSVHDELMIITSKDRLSILQARHDLLTVLGPGNSLGFDWAAMINPDEINVSQSLYEEDLGPAWWARLTAGDESVLQSLP